MTDQESDQFRQPSSKAEREAIDWLIRLTEMAADSEDTTAARQQIQDEFNLWATRSPANLRSFLEVASIFEALGECEAELVHELVARSPVAAPESPVPFRQRINWLWGPARALAATVVLVTVGFLFWRWAEGTTYRTQPGEWRRIRLEDGSVTFLSEQSEIRVSFSGAARKVSLRGQAMFDVASDPRKPFVVLTANAKIQALGTRFDVNDVNGPTRVTVVDGEVRVKTTSDASTRTLNREEGVEVSGQGIVTADHSQVEDIVASQRDVLEFDHRPLSVVAARMNLGSRRQVRFADLATAQKTISGRYMTDHPEGLVLAIQDLYPNLTVRETNDGWVVAEQGAGGHTK